MPGRPAAAVLGELRLEDAHPWPLEERPRTAPSRPGDAALTVLNPAQHEESLRGAAGCGAGCVG